MVALLHDFDYERYPDAEHHPFEGVAVLKSLGYPEWVTRAILSHADYSGVARESRLEKTLYACDEMSGFVTAAALVRPSKSVLDLEASSVVKRMKDKAFAKAVSRDDLRRGAEELGLPLAEHIGNVIRFMRERAEALGLKGPSEDHDGRSQIAMRLRRLGHIEREISVAESSLRAFVPSRLRDCGRDGRTLRHVCPYELTHG